MPPDSPDLLPDRRRKRERERERGEERERAI